MSELEGHVDSIEGNIKQVQGISQAMANSKAAVQATLFDQDGIAIRSGHHCTQPLMKRLGLTQTARVSFGLYNIMEDIDQLSISLNKINKFFK